MAEVLAHYSFLPWLRQGLAAKIAEADTLAAADGTAVERAALKIDLVVRDTGHDNATHDHEVTKNVQLIGPGDISALNTRAIIRTFPARGVPNFETNLLPYIEFYEEDFPWRFTPAAAAGPNARKLRPWIALIVLKKEEFTLTTPTQGLAVLNIKKDVIDIALPPHAETWAFAHVQISHPLNAPAEAAATLDANPDHGFSRLLSARKLVKNTEYTAFLIPAFETGRLAGLGLDPAGVKAQEPSWKKGQMTASTKPRPQDFPVYFHWNFSTSSGGDFETLVSILKPIETKADSGTLVMDIQAPGYGLDGAANSHTVGFEGALKPPTFQAKPFPAQLNGEEDAMDRDFVDRLRVVLNLSADLTEPSANGLNNKGGEVFNPFYEGSAADDPIVAPPTYGYWHALLKRLGEAGNPAWIETLNTDPRRRSVAGLGTQAVKDNQEDLMHRAWLQVDQINEANRKIREGIMARQVTSWMYAKHLVKAPDDKFLTVTAALQGLTKRPSAARSVRFEIKDSRIPLAAQSAAFRKMTRPQGNVSRVLEKTAVNPAQLQADVLKNFNIGGAIEGVGIAAAVLKSAPQGVLQSGAAISFVQQQSQQFALQPDLAARQAVSEVLENADLTQPVAALRSDLNAALAGEGLSPAALSLAQGLVNGLQTAQAEDSLQTLSFEPNSYEALFGPGANNKLAGEAVLKRAGEATEFRKIATIAGSAEAEAYLMSMNALDANVSGLSMPSVRPQLSATVSGLRADVQEKLNPAYTLDLKVRLGIKIWIGGVFQHLPALKPVMKYPVFPEPVYQHAKKMSQDYILPNVAKLPRNSITLMLSNQAFIESFLAGMNHEMARELLWREFPTDQRGSCFRQFWNADDNILETDAEQKLDIKEMHKWTGQLGQNAVRAGENLVLVVRGDLFLKYPDTIVYAQKAAYDPTDAAKQRILAEPADETNVRFPIFSAELEPDIFLFGFALGVEEARGERIRTHFQNPAGKNPGWFFAFKERPGQTKFGLDDHQDPIGGTTMPAGAPATWPDLTWEHLANAPADLNEFSLNFSKNIAITAPPAGQPNPVWAANAADMASILFQNPVIFARHADEMLED
jgi:hypothetical protein